MIRLQDRWRQHSDSERAAFTLIELLVVIAIIGTLASLLLPSLSQAKVRTRDTQCLNNFRQIGVMHKLYADDFGGFAPSGVREWDAARQRWRGRSTFIALGGVNPAPFPYSAQYPQATNRPLYRYQGNASIFRCPMDAGQGGDLDWPHHRTSDFPTAWSTAGASYLYNVELGAPRDDTRNPPLPMATLRPSRGSIARKEESWVQRPDRYILMNEPPAQPLNKYLTRPRNVWTSHWTQWHRNRGRKNFRDPTIAPPLFVSPVLFVDGHTAMHNFSQSVMTDPYYPYEETKDWQWYQPRD